MALIKEIKQFLLVTIRENYFQEYLRQIHENTYWFCEDKFEKVYPLSEYENSTENIQIKNEQSLSETTTEGETFEQDLEVIEESQEIDNFEQQLTALLEETKAEITPQDTKESDRPNQNNTSFGSLSKYQEINNKINQNDKLINELQQINIKMSSNVLDWNPNPRKELP
ncbi:167_t:CDS:1 [Ambispora gerdemannii]|uniref:167_t:CDS:1 n=1 Tax=Ambispora gerdemannii TaxID=144530 RepID=A0A9N9HG09_9GLOM|nr:167_t:CDS:1 [Ambispora gerdemannii]